MTDVAYAGGVADSTSIVFNGDEVEAIANETIVVPVVTPGPIGQTPHFSVEFENLTAGVPGYVLIDPSSTLLDVIIQFGLQIGAPGPAGPDRLAASYQVYARFPEPLFISQVPHPTYPTLQSSAVLRWPYGEHGTYTLKGVDGRGRPTGWITTLDLDVTITFDITCTYGDGTIGNPDTISMTISPAYEVPSTGLTSSVVLDTADSHTDAKIAAHATLGSADPHGDRNYAYGLFASLNAERYLGAINCSTNPNYPAADAGDNYRVSVAGKIGGASGTNVEPGDRLLCNVDSTAAGTQAEVGANWDILQANLDGAVIGPSSSGSGNFPSFNGTTGHLVNDSGYGPTSFSKMLTVQAVQTAGFTAVVGRAYPINTTSGAVPVVLPTAPAEGSEIFLLIVAGGTPVAGLLPNASTFTCGGSDVIDIAGITTGSLRTLFEGVYLRYSTVLGGWYARKTFSLTQMMALFAAAAPTSRTITGDDSIVASDLGRRIYVNKATAVNLTVPSGLGWPANGSCDIINIGVGLTTVVQGSGTTVTGTPGKKLRGTPSGATLVLTPTSETYVLLGDLST